jgi:hypothetical protein
VGNLERSARRILDDWAIPLMREMARSTRSVDDVMQVLSHEMRQDVRWLYPEVREWVRGRLEVRMG